MTDRQRQKLNAIRTSAPSFIGYSTFGSVLKVTFINKHNLTISQYIDARGHIRRSFQVGTCDC